jgi:hypothetical protein
MSVRPTDELPWLVADPGCKLWFTPAPPQWTVLRAFFGGGGRTRTYDLRIMRPSL